MKAYMAKKAAAKWKKQAPLRARQARIAAMKARHKRNLPPRSALTIVPEFKVKSAILYKDHMRLHPGRIPGCKIYVKKKPGNTVSSVSFECWKGQRRIFDRYVEFHKLFGNKAKLAKVADLFYCNDYLTKSPCYERTWQGAGNKVFGPISRLNLR